MPHSSAKDLNSPMDAWDRQRFGIALLEIEAVLQSILKGLDDGPQRQQMERARKAIHAAVEEIDN